MALQRHFSGTELSRRQGPSHMRLIPYIAVVPVPHSVGLVVCDEAKHKSLWQLLCSTFHSWPHSGLGFLIKGGRWYLGFLPPVKFSALVILCFSSSSVYIGASQSIAYFWITENLVKMQILTESVGLGGTRTPAFLTGSQVMLKLLICERLLVARI